MLCEDYTKSARDFRSLGRSSKPSYDDLTLVIIDKTNSNIAAWAAVICGLFGCIGNLLTIIVLLKKASLRLHSTTPFLLSLALSDLLFSAFNLPLMAVRFFERDWIFRLCTCQLFPFFFYANISISALSMTAVALNRYIGLFQPHLMDKIFSRINTFLILFFIWGLSFGLMLLPFFRLWGQLGYEPLIFSCTILDYYDKNPLVFLLVVGCGVPMIVITFCYFRILWQVKKTSKNVRELMDEQQVTNVTLARQLKKKEAQMTKTTALVWLGFVICFLPSTLIIMFDPMPPSKNAGLHVAGYIIFWCSAFINPLIYIASNKYYRAAMIEIICRRSVEDSEQITATSRLTSRTSSARSRRKSPPVQIQADPEERIHMNPR